MLRGFLQVKRHGTGHRISVTFSWEHPLHGTQSEGKAGLGRLAQSQGLGSACAISSQLPEWASCHCWWPGHSDPSLYSLPGCFVCSGTMVYVICCSKQRSYQLSPVVSWSTHPLFPCHPLHGCLGSSQPSDCGSLINKLIATLLWSHILCDCVELINFFWESLHLHPVFSEYSIPDNNFLFFWSPVKT